MTERIVIVTGGNLDEDFACDFINKENNPYIIGVDKGLEFLDRFHILPHEILGDFDSIDPKVYGFYKDNNDIDLKIYPCKKDNTDTQLAIIRASELIKEGKVNARDIIILGATGTRIDHVLGNIHGLIHAYDNGIMAYIYDKNNKIYLVPEEYRLTKNDLYGRYISFFPIDGAIELTLKGFEYPLDSYRLSPSNSIAISNELKEKEGMIIHKAGYLLCVESQD